ncbi:hypothetical protein [Pelagicoccus albus]|uniref:Uncharacterized protein n=1 Tax=Pelagicoccus albus TaxID=415222 RepID=A0A7X1E6Z7_9BACT|nr:hypothetical protein [Pelagicoccus albus]MBC2604804.1 hypothetical protein [Pelagicoccus albus]
MKTTIASIFTLLATTSLFSSENDYVQVVGTVSEISEPAFSQPKIEHGCVWFGKEKLERKTVWINIQEPEEYRGLKHVLASEADQLVEGQTITFSVLKSELDDKEKWPDLELPDSMTKVMELR